MLDEKLILNNPEAVKEALLKREFEVDFSKYLELKELRNNLLQKIEDVRAKRNKLSKSIGQYKREKKDTTELFKEIATLKDAVDKDEETLRITEEKITEFLYSLPNIPDEDLVGGGKEFNEVIRVNKVKPEFDFEIKDHVELATSLGLVDYERAAKISGKGTWIYSGMGARLEWALLNFFIDTHQKDGYQFMMLPHILNYESGLTAGQFPKFKDVEFLSVTLKPGDVLHVPSKWWHYVQSLDTSISISNFGYSKLEMFTIRVIDFLHRRGYYKTKNCFCCNKS